MPTQRKRHLVMILALSGAALSGCESTPSTGSLQDAVTDYNAGRYEQARETATAVLTSGTSGADRGEAAYLAGLSTYRQGRLKAAQDYFHKALTARDDQVVGRSRAMLGVIQLDQGHPTEAASLLSDAAKQLKGPEGQEAARQAASAYAAAGTPLTGSRWTKATGSSLSTATAFALQVGAFRERNRAENAARAVEPLARQHALGPVQVIQRTDPRGRTLFLVQLGRFSTRNAASLARNRIGQSEYIVATAAY
jgi:tetratricopeptide (TPR) repeat protein